MGLLTRILGYNRAPCPVTPPPLPRLKTALVSCTSVFLASPLIASTGKMADSGYFHQEVAFSTKHLEDDEVPKCCTVCGQNPAVLEYPRPVDPHSVNQENGYCGTACAFKHAAAA